jgi:hypothetical protein
LLINDSNLYPNDIALLCRYYKNSVDQQPGWNGETIDWCKREAERQNLKKEEYWGGLIVDEMKIQVHL